MKASLVLIVPTLWALTTVAHAENHTVTWYQQHASERAAMMRACLDDPGHIGRSPDCVNAEVANNRPGPWPVAAPIPCEKQSKIWQIAAGCGAYSRGPKQ